MIDEKKKGATKRAPRKRAKAKTGAGGSDTPGRKPDPAATDASKSRVPESARGTGAKPAKRNPTGMEVEGARQPARSTSAEIPPARVLATIPLHVRWRDLDAFNHVNNSSYLTFLEESRLQWLRDVPGDWFNAHAMPVMAAVELHYRKPITWPAEVDVQLSCERLGKSSITIGNLIVDRNDPSCVYADGNVVMVWVDPTSGASVPLPEAIRNAVS